MKSQLLIILFLSTILTCAMFDPRHIEIDTHDCYTQKSCNYFEKCRVFMTDDGNGYSRCQLTNTTTIIVIGVIMGLNYLTFKVKGFNLLTSFAVIVQSQLLMQLFLYTVPYSGTNVINTYFFDYLISYSQTSIMQTIVIVCIVWSNII